MYQEVLISTDIRLTLELPAELVGKQLRVVVFEETEGRRPVVTDPAPLSEQERARRIAEIEAITAPNRVDLSNFKFDRDWANDYDAE